MIKHTPYTKLEFPTVRTTIYDLPTLIRLVQESYRPSDLTAVVFRDGTLAITACKELLRERVIMGMQDGFVVVGMPSMGEYYQLAEHGAYALRLHDYHVIRLDDGVWVYECTSYGGGLGKRQSAMRIQVARRVDL